jgi:tRNA 2-thiouridine synthesizing protein D
MRFTLLVLTPPDAGASARHALGFARAAQAAGHDIGCVFFFDAGVLTALAGADAPQDEYDLRAGWSEFAAAADCRLLACVASAARFGLGENADRGRLRDGFEIAGLGELVDAGTTSDRLLTFAG